MIEDYILYVNNINGSIDEFIMSGCGSFAKFNLSKRSCSCRKYYLMKFPCAHVMTTLRLKHEDDYGKNIYDYSSPIYSKESYILAYLKLICTVPLESEWHMEREYLAMQVLPFDFDSKLGRRRVKCVKGLVADSGVWTWISTKWLASFGL
ncbi:hypothetical protein BC332_18411 [Capsicum chinense]|nr:hypothetical protein BC332_18411 [Capsicum chinense]